MKNDKLFTVILAASCLCACSDDNVFEIGEPIQECSNACPEKSDTCDSENIILHCADSDGDGCLDIVRERCESGQVCSNGKCTEKTSDTDECKKNSDCKDGQICTDGKCIDVIPEIGDCIHDTDCKEDQLCSKGKCIKKPVDEDECKQDTDCKDGQICTEGKCVDKIPSPECKQDTDCKTGQICTEGKCVDKTPDKPTCQDTCTGTVVCEGTGGYKECKDTNGDGCKEWTAVTNCASGQTCSNGKCETVTCKYTDVTSPGIHPLPSESKAGKSESKTSGNYTDEYLYDSTNYIKIGARRNWGGSIVFFGLADNNGSNTIDGNDTGREVQVAIYDYSRIRQGCAHNASCASSNFTCDNSITFLGWNPVQGGNRCNIGSPIDSVSNKDGIMEIVLTPLHWNPNWDATDCTSNGCSTSLKNRKSDVQLTQRLRFVRKHVVELFYSIRNLANINHTSHIQELPTLYAAYGAHGLGNYNRLMNADKTEIRIDQDANDDFFYKDFRSSEPWVTLQNTNLDYGVGILYENGLLDYQGWQKAGVFNNVRSRINFGLQANGTVNARAYLILGSFDTVKSEAHWLMKNIPPFGVLDTQADGKVSGNAIEVSGWALDNKQVTKVEARIDESTTIPLTYGTDRSDVCKVWVGYPSCNKVGYTGTVDISNLNKSCKHLLEIVATDSDGNTRVIANQLLTIN